jgi:HD-GYP domain-containing protein (c-di-GMP phosphodiesterase class II)
MSLSLGCSAKKSQKDKIQNVFRMAEEYMYHQKLLDGKSYRNTIINTLLATLYEKSTETEEHAKRLKSFCHSMGRNLGLSSKDMDDLSLLAILHDIGKVAINQNILQKPSSLTPEEWDEMKRHPEIGYRIAQTTPELAVVADFILSHHERWDGKGYPRGIKGVEIPLVCRILAVADSYDAMTNDRIYRKAMSHEKAVEELKSNAGTQFDPSVVDLFIDIIHSPPACDTVALSDDLKNIQS